ncbi:hypothetical protein AB2D70_05055 [Escherichia coli]
MVIILTDSLLSRFNKLNVPLYLHPGLPLKSVQQAYFTGFSAEVNSRLSMFAWGWHHEAGIHLLRLMLSGAFDKYPHLQVICAVTGVRCYPSGSSVLMTACHWLQRVCHAR